jgi:putative tricarboxylic transport membrane protein
VKKTRTTIASIALFWVALGVLLCYGATRLGIGTASEPGSGFIFFWSGLILVVLSLIAFAESLRNGEEEKPGTGAVNWRKITLVLLTLLSYAFFLEKLGFVLTTFVLMSFLLAMIEGRHWSKSLGVAGAAAAGSFAIFELWLKIRLPHGVFGF